MTDPKARERAQQWYNRWVQENFFGSSRNTVDSLAQLVLQVQAEGRLEGAEHVWGIVSNNLGWNIVMEQVKKYLVELRSQAGAEGGRR